LSKPRGKDHVRITGYKPAGVTKKAAEAVSKRVREAFERQGKNVRTSAIQFLPSTKVALDDGRFQVLANTTIEVSQNNQLTRGEAVGSVVTLSKVRGGSTNLEDVEIPALERRSAAS